MTVDNSVASILDVETAANFNDLTTHRGDFRRAIDDKIASAEVRSPDIDDRSYWEHQLQSFDRAFAALDDLLAKLPGIIQERNDASSRDYRSLISMGVGRGGGQLFVYGNHDSITAARTIIMNEFKLRARLEIIRRHAEAANAADQPENRATQMTALLEQVTSALAA